MDRVGTKDKELVNRSQSAPPWLATVQFGITAVVVLLVGTTGWFVFRHLRAEATDSEAPVACREAIWDFGELSQEKPEHLHHRFKLVNLTTEKIHIEKVMPDCGCVVADKPPNEIGPGATVELPVNVNVAGPPWTFSEVSTRCFGNNACLKTDVNHSRDDSAESRVVPSSDEIGIWYYQRG